MAESAFAGCKPVTPAHAGAAARPVEPLSVVSVTAWPGREAALADAVRSAWGLELPEAGRWTHGPDVVAMWVGPRHWWLQRERAGAFSRELAALGDHAALIDMSDARAMLRIGGPDSRDILSSLLPIDLHPRGFAPGRAASTIAAHIGVQVRQLDTAPTYDISCPRSFAGSLWRALELAGAGRLRLELAEAGPTAVSAASARA